MIHAELIKYSPSEVKPYMKIILSVPAENAQAVIAELGFPTPGESIWLEVKRIEGVKP
jgi:hypothetical protein